MKLTIAIPDDFPPQIKGTKALERLREYGVIELYDTKASSQEEFIQRMNGAQAVINVRAYSKFTEEILKKCCSLKLLSVLGTGTDNIDLGGASKCNIVVTNTPGFAAVAVAEHALALMLAVARQIPFTDRQVKKGEWPRGLMNQLYGKVLGLIGLGKIGQQLAGLGRGIGMKVISWTFHPSKERTEKYGVSFVSLQELLKRADVISLHLRLSEKTINLIGKREFSLMKPEAILINTARGAVANKEALIHALTKRKIAGAGLDVFDQEPLSANDPLFKLDNVVLSPHSAGMTSETIEKGAEMAVDNIINFFNNNLTNVVNKEMLPNSNTC